MNIQFLDLLEKKYPQLTDDVAVIREDGYGWESLRDKLVENNGCIEAIQISKNQLEEKKTLALSHSFVAETYELCGDIDSAINTYENALNSNIQHTTHLYKDYAKLSEKYYPKEKVIKIYTEFVDNKSYLPIHKNFIYFLLSINELDYVVTECKRATERHESKTQNLLFTLSEVYTRRGEFSKAKEALTHLITVNKNNGKAWRKLSAIERELALEENSAENIVRMIEFTPEYHSAGISILQNFGKLLRDKYGKTPVKVSIIQNDLSVKMVIIPPDGKKIEVEEYLSKYGLVINGQMDAEDLLTDPKQLLELKTELRLAHTRIEIQREQMQFIDNQHLSKISSLEEQVNWLRTQVGNSLAIQQDNYRELLNILANTNKNNSKITKKMISALTNQNLPELKKVMAVLKKEEPEEYTRLKDFISNTVSSIGANAPTWIEFMSKVLPS